MVTPSSHFFAFHWLCCLFPIGYLPKPGSVGGRITEYNHVHRSRWYSGIFGRKQLSQHPPIDSTCGHSDISAINLLILSSPGCSYLNIHRYTAHVSMMTFQWSHRSYQSIKAIQANSSAQTESLLYSLERAAGGLGLHVNANKTE